MRVYLVRHGETELNARKCYYGLMDTGLTEKGKAQAKLLGESLKEITFDRIIASPLVRAVTTAEYVRKDRSLSIETDERLMEQNFGIFEGMTAGEIVETYPGEWQNWNKDFSNHVIKGGESFAQVRARIDDFIENGLPKDCKTLLLVAHKGTLGHMLASLLHMPLEGYWNFVFDQGSYNVIDIEDGYAIIRGLNIPV